MDINTLFRFIYTILNIVDGTKEGMTNPSSATTIILATTIATLTTIGLFTSLSGGMVQAQSTAATQASRKRDTGL